MSEFTPTKDTDEYPPVRRVGGHQFIDQRIALYVSTTLRRVPFQIRSISTSMLGRFALFSRAPAVAARTVKVAARKSSTSSEGGPLNGARGCSSDAPLLLPKLPTRLLALFFHVSFVSRPTADTSKSVLTFYHQSGYALVALTPVAFILSPSWLNFPVDLALGVIFPVHSHIAINYVITDYVPKVREDVSREPEPASSYCFVHTSLLLALVPGCPRGGTERPAGRHGHRRGGPAQAQPHGSRPHGGTQGAVAPQEARRRRRRPCRQALA